jgi:hypothetical protein
MKAQFSQIASFSGNPETSQGENGSYDRLSEIVIPVLIANGNVSFALV